MAVEIEQDTSTKHEHGGGSTANMIQHEREVPASPISHTMIVEFFNGYNERYQRTIGSPQLPTIDELKAKRKAATNNAQPNKRH